MTAIRTEKDIELLLIWAYQDQCVGSVQGLPAGARSVDDDGPVVGQCSSPGGPVHEDAEALYQAVGKLPKDIRQRVADCARSGLRPDWMQGAVTRAEPFRGWKRNRATGEIVTNDGRPVPFEYEYEAAYRGGKAPAWCRIIWLNRPEQIDAAQLRYLEWWSGLAILAGLKLREFKACGPAAPRAPWQGKKKI